MRWLIYCVCLAVFPGQVFASEDTDKPRLIVQITVDGLRNDLLTRYRSGFGSGGFLRLIENGVWYTNAHHLHANTETIVGHATLATGAHPAQHGMVGNVWLDQARGILRYNIEDPEHPVLQVPGFQGEGDQVDPAQAIARAGGRSPKNMLVSTFGDELYKSNNGRSKVIGVSGKDRGAVAMAGHTGKAFWLSTATGAFETSTYYYDAYPDWALAWNAKRPADAVIGTAWELADDPRSYLFADNDDRPYEVDLRGFGRTFPHTYGTPEDGLFYTQVLIGPIGDELTADFAKAAIRAEELGGDDYPDFLSVSFSSVDAVNHFFGPSSLENEEIMRRLDRTLADFFSFVDEEVGHENVLYVLSADHGMPEMPEYMAQLGFTVERNFNGELQEELNERIAAEFGVSEAVKYFFRPYLYLDHDEIDATGVAVREIEQFIVDDLMARDGITMAMPREPFPEQIGHMLEEPIRRNFHPQRSGDIYVAQSPYSFLFEKGPAAVMHGSPWRFDTHVPIIVSGTTIAPRIVNRFVGTVDIAPTLSLKLGATLPSGSSGGSLTEVFIEPLTK